MKATAKYRARVARVWGGTVLKSVLVLVETEMWKRGGDSPILSCRQVGPGKQGQGQAFKFQPSTMVQASRTRNPQVLRNLPKEERI